MSRLFLVNIAEEALEGPFFAGTSGIVARANEGAPTAGPVAHDVTAREGRARTGLRKEDYATPLKNTLEGPAAATIIARGGGVTGPRGAITGRRPVTQVVRGVLTAGGPCGGPCRGPAPIAAIIGGEASISGPIGLALRRVQSTGRGGASAGEPATQGAAVRPGGSGAAPCTGAIGPSTRARAPVGPLCAT